MATSDWKTPFLKFRDELRRHREVGPPLYHSILMSPFFTKNEIGEVIKSIAAADEGQPWAATVEMPTYDCKYHAQFFYGQKATCNRLSQALMGIERWLIDVPKGLLPRFYLQYPRNAECTQLATWANIVYYLAWEIDAHYLQATVEYQAQLHEVTSVPWCEVEWPETCDPRPALIRQGTSEDYVSEFLKSYTIEGGRWCPDIIGAYISGGSMCGDFITASMAAADILVFMLDQVRGQETDDPNKLRSSVKKMRQSRSREISNEVILLRGLLESTHNAENHGQKARTPLTAEQIAIALEWFSESGKPLQARVSRRMKEIYGPNGMEKYRSLFVRGKIRRGIFINNSDGTTAVDGYVEEEEEEDNSNENDLD